MRVDRLTTPDGTILPMAEPSGKHRLRWLVVALILTIFLAIVSFPLSACLNSGYGSDERVLAVPAECDEDFTQVGTYVLFYEKQGLTDVPVIHPGGRIEYPDGLSVEISNSGKGVVPTGLAWGIMEQGPWSGSILRGPQVTIAAPGLYHFSLQFATAKPATPWGFR